MTENQPVTPRTPALAEAPPAEPQRRGVTGWGVAFAACLVVVLFGIALLFVRQDQNQQHIGQQDAVIVAQNNVIGQVCRVAGGQVAADPSAQVACERVQRGEPAVPVATPISGTNGTNGVGIQFTRQVDRCYVEVGLTSGAVNRFGPFCGPSGQTGPTGKAGPSGSAGPSGANGVDGASGAKGDQGDRGVGIADVQPDGCDVIVTLTDGTSRTVGPFCANPDSQTFRLPDGTVRTCTRDGGDLANPQYTCTDAAPTSEPATTTSEPPVSITTTATTQAPASGNRGGGLLPIPTG